MTGFMAPSKPLFNEDTCLVLYFFLELDSGKVGLQSTEQVCVVSLIGLHFMNVKDQFKIKCHFTIMYRVFFVKIRAVGTRGAKGARAPPIF